MLRMRAWRTDEPARHRIGGKAMIRATHCQFRRMRSSALLCRQLALVLLGCTLGSVAFAQVADDAVTGRSLYENTRTVLGGAVTNNCTDCHGAVQDRRQRIGGDPYAEIPFDLAMTRLVGALQSVAPMSQFRSMSLQQARDLATYIADTPKTSLPRLDFSAALNMPSAPQSVDLQHAVATAETLTIDSVSIAGGGADRFTRSADACQQQTIAAGASCRISIGFAASDTLTHDASLIFTLREGASASVFTRTVALRGVVDPSQPPPDPDEPQGGGGAFGCGWLAALALATALLLRRRLTG